MLPFKLQDVVEICGMLQQAAVLRGLMRLMFAGCTDSKGWADHERFTLNGACAISTNATLSVKP